MAATTDTSHSFDPIDGEIELIEIRAFSAPPAHTDKTTADYAAFEGPDVGGFTDGYLSTPIDPTAEDIVHQSIQIVEWADGGPVSVDSEDEGGAARAGPKTERAGPKAEEVERPDED